MPSDQVRRLDPSECTALIRALGDTPETVIAVHQLRQGLCQAYAETGSGRHDAVVLRPFRPSDELVGFGPDAESLGRVLRSLSGWSCVCVKDGIARRLGSILEAGKGQPIHYIMDIYGTPCKAGRAACDGFTARIASRDNAHRPRC
jgi:hypothetical protein